MATLKTPTSAPAWRPDGFAFSAADVIPEAAVLLHSTVAGRIEGDQPLLHVGYVDDDQATITAEAAELDLANPALAEVAVVTSKITQLVKISREQWVQEGTADQLSQSVGRAIITRADQLFFAEAKPVAPAVAPAAGLVNVDGVVDGGEVDTNLDGLVDLLAILQSHKATPTGIVVDPLAWGELRKLKIGVEFHQTLLGAGTNDADPRLLGLPLSVNASLPQYSGVVIDKSAVVSAVSAVQVATSLDQFFTSDSVALRATWRVGSTCVRPDRIGKFTVAHGGTTRTRTAK